MEPAISIVLACYNEVENLEPMRRELTAALDALGRPYEIIYVDDGSSDNTDAERYSPGERYGRVYQINYLRCILCGLCIEACPTRALTMTNDFKLADTSREKMIYTKDRLLAPLLPGMEEPPHPRRLGDDEKDYFLGLPPTGVPDMRTGPVTAKGAHQ